MAAKNFIKNIRANAPASCEVVKTVGVNFPAIYVGPMTENRNQFEMGIAWVFEFRATFRNGEKKYLEWKISGLPQDKGIVIERLKRRADIAGIVLIEMCCVWPALDQEQRKEIEEFNQECSHR